MWGFAPALNRLGRDLGFTQFVIGGCVVLYALMLASGSDGITTGGILNLFSPSLRALFLFGESGRDPVFGYGRWWTVLTAGWLHAGLLHIFFNLMWIRQLAPPTSEMYGASRMIIIYTIAGIIGFTASTLAGAFVPLPIWRRRIHRRRLGPHLRIARRADVLRQTHRQQHGRRSGEVLGGDALHLRLHHARSRQLGSRWRFRWRICHIEVPGSATSGTPGSPDCGLNVPSGDRNRYRVFGSQWVVRCLGSSWSLTTNCRCLSSNSTMYSSIASISFAFSLNQTTLAFRPSTNTVSPTLNLGILR